MVLRGRGDAERARTVRARLEKTVLGDAGTICLGALGGDPILTSCAVTNGGGPVPCVEDAVSSYSALAAKGELTVTERVGDVSLGDDIRSAQQQNSSPFTKLRLTLLLPQRGA